MVSEWLVGFTFSAVFVGSFIHVCANKMASVANV